MCEEERRRTYGALADGTPVTLRSRRGGGAPPWLTGVGWGCEVVDAHTAACGVGCIRGEISSDARNRRKTGGEQPSQQCSGSGSGSGRKQGAEPITGGA